MNEKFKELKAKAIVPTQNPAGYTSWVFDEQRFAELIILECLDEIQVADVGDLKGKGYYLDKVAEHLERHFGVEWYELQRRRPKDEKIFELRQENIRLRGQITYLQEELSSVEDEKDKEVERLNDRIAELEEQLGDALYNRS